ncbi:MAG: ankyrin repeat domain-containing protein, partial [Desulfovibrio sp.]|nr:ankyrin repeat domain-containing protein [Desulfovibrio sp.]
VGVTDVHGRTPLHTAAQRDDPGACRLLADAGCPLDAQDSEGRTALRLAVEEDFADSCVELLSLGADPGVRANDGLTAEEWALAHPAQCTLVLEEVFPQNRR